MKTDPQLLEEGAFAALNTFRDRCPRHLPAEQQHKWRLGFGGACLRILRETHGSHRAPLPDMRGVVRLTWRERWRLALGGRAEISVAGDAFVVGELRGFSQQTAASLTAPPVLATWAVARAERRDRRLQAAAAAGAAEIARAEQARAAREPEPETALPPAPVATRTEP